MSKLYEKSGVNLKKANLLNDKIGKNLGISAFAEKTFLAEGLKLVTCCDGIGSKIIPLYEKEMYSVIAQDVVAANLNDLVCTGATAVGFVDYLSVNKLDEEAVFEIVKSIREILNDCDCSLLGGETSEISELITDGNVDIAGFAVGIVKDGDELDKKNVKPGDVVIGLVSSGVHANGFSLVRKLFKENIFSEIEFNSTLAPTNIYYNKVRNLVKKGLIKSAANITGGGVFSNLVRAIPKGLSVELDYKNIPKQDIFDKLKEICKEEFYEVFNGGVGFCLIAEEKNKEEIFEICSEFSPFIFGKIGE